MSKLINVQSYHKDIVEYTELEIIDFNDLPDNVKTYPEPLSVDGLVSQLENPFILLTKNGHELAVKHRKVTVHLHRLLETNRYELYNSLLDITDGNKASSLENKQKDCRYTANGVVVRFPVPVRLIRQMVSQIVLGHLRKRFGLQLDMYTDGYEKLYIPRTLFRWKDYDAEIVTRRFGESVKSSWGDEYELYRSDSYTDSPTAMIVGSWCVTVNEIDDKLTLHYVVDYTTDKPKD